MHVLNDMQQNARKEAIRAVLFTIHAIQILKIKKT